MATYVPPDGTVYVLTNASLKGMVKIGFTTRSAAIRAKELSTTSLPTPFEVAFETDTIASPRILERAVHNNLIASRIQNGREFFKVTPQEAIVAIQSLLTTHNQDSNDDPVPQSHTFTVEVPDGVTELVIKLQSQTLTSKASGH
jgi:hypothetical protein